MMVTNKYRVRRVDWCIHSGSHRQCFCMPHSGDTCGCPPHTRQYLQWMRVTLQTWWFEVCTAQFSSLRFLYVSKFLLPSWIVCLSFDVTACHWLGTFAVIMLRVPPVPVLADTVVAARRVEAEGARRAGRGGRVRVPTLVHVTLAALATEAGCARTPLRRRTEPAVQAAAGADCCNRALRAVRILMLTDLCTDFLCKSARFFTNLMIWFPYNIDPDIYYVWFAKIMKIYQSNFTSSMDITKHWKRWM